MAIPELPAAELLQKGLQMASLHGLLLESFAAQDIQVFNMTSKTHFHCTPFNFLDLCTLTWSGVAKANTQCKEYKNCGKVA